MNVLLEDIQVTGCYILKREGTLGLLKVRVRGQLFMHCSFKLSYKVLIVARDALGFSS